MLLDHLGEKMQAIGLLPPRELANAENNTKRRKNRLRITPLPMTTRHTPHVSLLSPDRKGVCLSSVLMVTPHASRLFHVLQRWTRKGVKNVHDAAISPRLAVPQRENGLWRMHQNNACVLCGSGQTSDSDK